MATALLLLSVSWSPHAQDTAATDQNAPVQKALILSETDMPAAALDTLPHSAQAPRKADTVVELYNDTPLIGRDTVGARDESVDTDSATAPMQQLVVPSQASVPSGGCATCAGPGVGESQSALRFLVGNSGLLPEGRGMASIARTHLLFHQRLGRVFDVGFTSGFRRDPQFYRSYSAVESSIRRKADSRMG